MRAASLIAFFLLLATAPVFGVGEVYEDGDVYINDSQAYIRASPAFNYGTCAYDLPAPYSGSACVELTVVSKTYTGALDFMAGYNKSYIKPRALFRNVSSVEYYNVTEYDNVTNASMIVTYNNTYDWSLYQPDFIKFNKEYNGKDNWFVIDDFNVVAGREYKALLVFHVPRVPLFQTAEEAFPDYDAKWDFAFKLGSYPNTAQGLNDAIANNHIKILDPFSYPRTADLIFNLSLDESSGTNAVDTFSYVYNFTSAITNWTDGNFGNSLGSLGDNYLKRASSATKFGFTARNDWTFGAWIKPHSLSRTEYLFHPRGDLDGRIQITSAGEISLFTYDGGVDTFTTTATVSANEWTFIAAGINTTHKFVCINDQIESAAYTGTPAAGGSFQNTIGVVFSETASTIFNGSIDEAFLYDDGLTADDCLSIYDVGNAPTVVNITTSQTNTNLEVNVNATDIGNITQYEFNVFLDGGLLNDTSVTTNHSPGVLRNIWNFTLNTSGEYIISSRATDEYGTGAWYNTSAFNITFQNNATNLSVSDSTPTQNDQITLYLACSAELGVNTAMIQVEDPDNSFGNESLTQLADSLYTKSYTVLKTGTYNLTGFCTDTSGAVNSTSIVNFVSSAAASPPAAGGGGGGGGGSSEAYGFTIITPSQTPKVASNLNCPEEGTSDPIEIVAYNTISEQRTFNVQVEDNWCTVETDSYVVSGNSNFAFRLVDCACPTEEEELVEKIITVTQGDAEQQVTLRLRKSILGVIIQDTNLLYALGAIGMIALIGLVTLASKKKS